MESRLWLALEDDCCREKLVVIARQHVKLALEFSRRETSLERKAIIKAEIETLRIERNRLLYMLQPN